ncbi:MAG: methyltransferase, TIGR04325 family [Halopseudomonas sp.]
MREIAKACLPSGLLRWLRKGGNRFEGDYAAWGEASRECCGYDADAILDKVLAASLKVKRGDAAYERDSITFDQLDYSWPLLSGLMWGAARNSGHLNVLDFGGSLGSTYFQNLSFLQALPKIDWSVVEQPHYVEAGQTHIQSEGLRFYSEIDECHLDRRPNTILLSSVLQYLDSPFDILDRLSNIGASCLIIDRTPFSNLDHDCITIQVVPESIYSARYPMWIFSYSKFVDLFSHNWRIISELPCPEGDASSGNGVKFNYKGLVLEAIR